MKSFRLISLTMAAVLFLTVNVFAGIASDTRIAPDDFENCVDGLDASWKAQNGSVPVVKTERGKSAKLESPSSMLELIRFFTATKANESSVAFGFGMKFDGLPRISIYIKTNSGVETSIVTVADGVLNCGNGSSGAVVIESGKWYDFFVEYNMQTGYTRCFVTDGTNSITVCGEQGRKELTEIIRIDFALYKTTTIAYVDDVWFSTLQFNVAPYAQAGAPEGAIVDILPASGYVDIGTDEISVNFSQPPDVAKAEDIKAGLNGDESMIESVRIEGNSLILKLAEPMDSSQRILLEFSGVSLGNDNTHSGVVMYYTKPLCTISDMQFSTQELAAGELVGSVNISCDNGLIDKALLLLVLYDSETGNIAAQHFTASAVSETPTPIQTSVTVPDDGREYKAVLYLWDDMFNMMSLCQTLELD